MFDRVYIGVTKAEFVKAEGLLGAPKSGAARGSVVWTYEGIGEATWRPAGAKSTRGYGFVRFEKREAA